MLRRSQSGITLMEILVVIVAIGLLTAMAKAPMTRYMKTIEQKKIVVGVKKTLLAARSRALANPAVHCGVYFDLASKPQKAVMFYDSHSPGTYTYNAAKDKAYLSPFIIPSGVTLAIVDPYPSSVIYRGDGSAFLSAKVVLKSSAFSDTIDVLASTGRIRSTR